MQYKGFFWHLSIVYCSGVTTVGVTAGAALFTTPLIVRNSVPPSPLCFTVTVFVKLPGLPLELYIAVITPSFPGAIGSLVHFGVVHPQDAFTLLSTSASFPVFLNVKVTVACTPSSIVPKSSYFFSRLILD